MDKPQIIGHLYKSLNYTLFDCKWLPVSTKFVIVGSNPRDTGQIQIYDVTTTEFKLVLEAEKSKSYKCCTFGASRLPDAHLATGAFDGRMAIWDLGDGGRLDVPLYAVQGHKEIINTIDGVGGLGIGEGAPELATGSRDGFVKVWDPRQPKTPVVTMGPSDETISDGSTESPRDCWTLAFGHAYNIHDRCLVAGYDNGDIKLFDLRAMRVRWETNLHNGVCSLEFDRKDINMNKLVATTLESRIHVFDMRTQHPQRGFASLTEKAHDSTVWQVRHLPQQRDIFMTTGGNGSLCLWKYHYPEKRQKMVKMAATGDSDEKEVEVAEGVMGKISLLQNITLSSQPIASLDWCKEKMGLAICVGFDQALRLLIVTKLNRV
ncbi:hypothetical protein Aperf_G00000025963 [Anoplocephala perfoliata]